MSAPSAITDLTHVSHDLDAMLAAVWRELSAAAGNPAHPWRIANMGTLDEQHPRQRIVILRDVIPRERTILVHTDLRSPKVAQLQRNPGASWLWYDWQCKIQLVASGASSLHTRDDVAERLWDAAGPRERALYRAPLAPGTPAPEPFANGTEADAEVSPADETAARDRFAVVRSVLDSLDVLWIRDEGNLRAQFLWDSGVWQNRWICP